MIRTLAAHAGLVVALVTLLCGVAHAAVPPVPVVLVHGICGDSLGTFGALGTLLASDLPGVEVHAFDYSARHSTLPDGTRASLRALAGELGAFVARLGAPEVDVVTHSMGGLIVRAWMSGVSEGGPVYRGQIRRLVTAGTPHFGLTRHIPRGLLTFLAAIGGCAEHAIPVLDAQIDQMLFGSAFLADLNAAWPAVILDRSRILTVVGCVTELCKDDLVVSSASAALPETTPDSHVVYVPKVHPGLATVAGRADAFYGVVLPFLGDGVPGGGFSPEAVETLVVAPLVTPHATPHTRDETVRFGLPREGAVLLDCLGLFATRFVDESPAGPTGWWTLTDVEPGCWTLFVRSRLLGSDAQRISVTPGRPLVADPIVVTPTNPRP